MRAVLNRVVVKIVSIALPALIPLSVATAESGNRAVGGGERSLVEALALEASELEAERLFELEALIDELAMLEGEIPGPEDDPDGTDDPPTCPQGTSPAKVLGVWLCLSDLKPDEYYRKRLSLQICDPVDGGGYTCVKIRYRCDNGPCVLEIIPPTILLPKISCELQQEGDRNVIRCKNLPPFESLDYKGGDLTLKYVITEEGEICISALDGDKAICIPYTGIPGIMDLIPLFPGYVPPREPPAVDEVPDSVDGGATTIR